MFSPRLPSVIIMLLKYITLQVDHAGLNTKEAVNVRLYIVSLFKCFVLNEEPM